MKKRAIITEKVEGSFYDLGEGTLPTFQLSKTIVIRFLGIPIYRKEIKNTID